MFVIVECYDVPTNKYVESVFENGRLVERQYSSVFKNLTQTTQSVMSYHDWCGTCRH